MPWYTSEWFTVVICFVSALGLVMPIFAWAFISWYDERCRNRERWQAAHDREEITLAMNKKYADEYEDWLASWQTPEFMDIWRKENKRWEP